MSGDIVFGVERVRDLWDELPALIQAHAAERGLSEPIDLNVTQYEVLDALGALRCFTVRKGKRQRLVGYATFYVGGTMHHRSTKIATHEALYVLPKCRAGGLGLRLIRYTEQSLAHEGCTRVTQTAPTDDHARMLARLGYRMRETTFDKDL